MNKDEDGVIRFAVENGFNSIELWGDVPFLNPDTTGTDKRKKISRNLVENGIITTMHAPIFGININCVNPGIREESIRQVKKCIDMAVDMSCGLVVLHTGSRPSSDQKVKGYTFDLLCRSLEDIKEHTKGKNIVVTLENNGIEDCWEGALEDFIDIIDTCGFKCTMDVGHANCTWGLDRTMKALGSRIAHFHMSDNKGDCDAHLAVGTGDIDFTSLAGFLQGFEGILCHEIQAPDDPESATLKSRENMDGIMERYGKEDNKDI